MPRSKYEPPGSLSSKPFYFNIVPSTVFYQLFWQKNTAQHLPTSYSPTKKLELVEQINNDGECTMKKRIIFFSADRVIILAARNKTRYWFSKYPSTASAKSNLICNI